MKEVNSDQEADDEEEGWKREDLMGEKRSSSIVANDGDPLEFRPP